ncbi:MAG: hypothetical protein ABJF23_11165, partial [Bryobacteraceae bacterium]
MDQPTYLRPRALHYTVRERQSRFIAHCLDYDLVATGSNQQEALDRLNFLVGGHVEVAAKNGMANPLLHTAPDEFWAEFHSQPHQTGLKIKIGGLSSLDQQDKKIYVGIVATIMTSRSTEH